MYTRRILLLGLATRSVFQLKINSFERFQVTFQGQNSWQLSWRGNSCGSSA